MPRRRAEVVVLVGRGAPPADLPRSEYLRLRSLELDRITEEEPVSAEEEALDQAIRDWPRTEGTDSYRAGLESLARALGRELTGARVVVAYERYCAPTLEQAVGELIDQGVLKITVVPTLLVAGGSRADVSIPDKVARLRAEYPELDLDYAWPFGVERVARMIRDHLADRI